MLTLSIVQNAYARAKKYAQNAAHNRNWEQMLYWIETCADIAYQFNWIYTDRELEAMLRQVSEQEITPRDFSPVAGRVCFYDAFFLDYRGLTQQYLRALSAADKEILIISENSRKSTFVNILAELAQNPRCRIIELPANLSRPDRMRFIYNTIADFAPESLLMHLAPASAVAVAAFNALTKVKRYQVNLTDHAFWLGVGCLDYSLEFRDYGCTVSIDQRGIPREKIIRQPFYPIIGTEVFGGFPAATQGKVVMLSGGVAYKVMGKDNAFFELVRQILEHNPTVVFLFAGGGDLVPMRQFFKRCGLLDRCCFLGTRRDIDEVVAHCDIYLTTYPITGGLMSQYAAANAKPIVAYNSPDLRINEIEDFVCINENISVTMTDQSLVLAEVRHLVEDAQYRRERGEQLRRAMLTQAAFDRDVRQILETQTNGRTFAGVEIDYQAFTELYLEVARSYTDTFKRTLLRRFRLGALVIYPGLLLFAVRLTYQFWVKKRK